MNNKKKHQKWLVILMGLFYIAAGINHFRVPDFYIPLIPGYLGSKQWINAVSGMTELLLGIGILIPRTAANAAVLIIIMLIAFIPSHIWMITEGGCFPSPSLCIPLWIAWIRLLLVQPLLIAWSAYVRALSKPPA